MYHPLHKCHFKLFVAVSLSPRNVLAIYVSSLDTQVNYFEKRCKIIMPRNMKKVDILVSQKVGMKGITDGYIFLIVYYILKMSILSDLKEEVNRLKVENKQLARQLHLDRLLTECFAIIVKLLIFI